MIELGSIPSSGLPAFQNVRFVRIEHASAIGWLTALREGFGCQKPMDRLGRQFQSTGDLSLGDCLLMERSDSFITNVAVRAADLRWCFFWRQRGRVKGSDS